MSETLSAISDTIDYDTDNFDESLDSLGIDIDFQDIALPSLVPVPRRSGEITIISRGTSDPRAVAGIRDTLGKTVDTISKAYQVALPTDAIVLVGSELVTNAIHLSRKLISCSLEYTHFATTKNARPLGRLALFVSDNEPGFPEDPDRPSSHRGLAIVTDLSASVNHFLIHGVRGKTVFAEFDAMPLDTEVAPADHEALALDASAIG